MRHPRVVVFEWDDLLAGMLQELTALRRWVLLTPRLVSGCREQLCHGGPMVLVLRLGRHLEQELELLAEVSLLHPSVAAVVVGESAQAPLAGLAWDLGAAYVLLLPQPNNWLPEIVAGLMGLDG